MVFFLLKDKRSTLRAGEEDDHILSFSLRSCVRPVSRNGDEKVIPCQPLTLNGVLRRRVGLRNELRKDFPLLIPWFLAHARHETTLRRTQGTGPSL
jgi:hypothetical protein